MRFRVGYCPHPVTVYIRGPIKGYIQSYYNYYPTVTEGGQYPNNSVSYNNTDKNDSKSIKILKIRLWTLFNNELFSKLLIAGLCGGSGGSYGWGTRGLDYSSHEHAHVLKAITILSTTIMTTISRVPS